MGKLNYKLLIASLVISIILLFVVLKISFISQDNLEEGFELYSLSLKGYKEVSVNVVAQNSITLTNSCRQITASTSKEQAESIYNSINGIELPRPNSHDIIKYSFEEYQINVIGVKIEEVIGNNYISKIILQKENKVLNLDARPSDAVAIAIRLNKPIFIKEELLDSFGTDIC